MTILSGCLSKPRVEITPVELQKFHPELPAPLNLETEEFVLCPNEDPAQFVCIDHANVRKITRNKTKFLRWSKEMRAIVDFYRTVPGPYTVDNNNNS
jgi:hypothetical protein